jgi:hypothetical protein
MRDRMKLAWKEDTISSILTRLDRHKSSLSLMLTIVQWYVYELYYIRRLYCYTFLNTDAWFSESDLEAERSQGILRGLMQQLLESNLDLSRRLRNLEDTYDSESNLTTCFRNGSSAEADDTGEGADLISYQSTSLDSEDSSNFLHRTNSQFSFESDLDTSRVYRRTRPYPLEDASFTSSAIRTHVWSIFSGLSLSQVSNISALALPVYSDDISNSQRYNFIYVDRLSHLDMDVPPGNPPPVEAADAGRSAWNRTHYKLVVLGDGDIDTMDFTNQVDWLILGLYRLIKLHSCCATALLKPLTQRSTMHIERYFKS